MSQIAPSRGAKTVSNLYSDELNAVDPGPRSLPQAPPPRQSRSEGQDAPSFVPPWQTLMVCTGRANAPPDPMICSLVARTPALSVQLGVADQVACTKPFRSWVFVGPGNGFNRFLTARKFVNDRSSMSVPVFESKVTPSPTS